MRGPSGEEGYFAAKIAAFLKTKTSAAKEKIELKRECAQLLKYEDLAMK